MRSHLTLLVIACLSTACAQSPGASGGFGGGGSESGSGGGLSDEGRNTDGAEDAGSESSGGDGSNTVYIVNDSSYEICYSAICDCDVEECAEAELYVAPGYYTAWDRVPDMCVYIYVEDCYGYAYWDDILDVYDDVTWTITD